MILRGRMCVGAPGRKLDELTMNLLLLLSSKVSYTVSARHYIIIIIIPIRTAGSKLMSAKLFCQSCGRC